LFPFHKGGDQEWVEWPVSAESMVVVVPWGVLASLVDAVAYVVAGRPGGIDTRGVLAGVDQLAADLRAIADDVAPATRESDLSSGLDEVRLLVWDEPWVGPGDWAGGLGVRRDELVTVTCRRELELLCWVLDWVVSTIDDWEFHSLVGLDLAEARSLAGRLKDLGVAAGPRDHEGS